MTGGHALDRDHEHEQRRPALEAVRPGMVVEATEGDLGTSDDISKPKVKDVLRDEAGNVAGVVVEKGAVFKKEIEVPASRIARLRPAADGDPAGGEVVIAAREPEIESLAPAGAEALPPIGRRPEDASDTNDLLGDVEERVPTAEGQRRNEGEAEEQRRLATERRRAADIERDRRRGARLSLRTLGPGLLAGMSGNDSTAVTAYAVNGATAGFGQLWLMLLSTPLYQAVIYACAKIGRVTRQGMTGLLRAHFGRKVAFPIAILLLVANVALIAGDLTAIGSGLELITGLRWIWFVVPAAAALWYVTVYQSFGVIKKVFLVMSFAFVAYLITSLLSGADWGTVLHATFVPQLSFDFAGISAAMALLGATLSPYTMFWQVQGEQEQERPGTLTQQTRLAALDIATGTIGGNLIAYFIMLTTAATLFTHHHSINTAADAARALEPLLGPFAKYLFAIGFIGAGTVAIPVLIASTSYAMAGAFGWSASLWRKPWQSEGFYLIMTAALAVSVALALIGLNPIKFIFWSNILRALLAPVLIAIILLVGNSRRIMRHYRLGMLTNVSLGAAILITVAGAILLFYGLATGQGG